MRGKAVGDPCAAAFSDNNTWLTVAAGGTHELLIFQNSAIPLNGGDPRDTLEEGVRVKAMLQAKHADKKEEKKEDKKEPAKPAAQLDKAKS